MSVPHRTSKRPWGTITKPDDMHMGYQKTTEFEIDQVVERLYEVPKERPVTSNRPNKNMTRDEIEDMVDRLSRNGGEKASDSQRVAKGALKDIGILNSFAWKGYNY
ncbi:uncharacterized protein LOC129262206 [Lytechinus pictus]|uniref:uncharacterized protein LOC129262206 n=1 Tax=Lytechinus pictus TaxID=7653 RepID=UPI00240DB6C4|nr:uncharacterized protein LOC129262206 [Lytechinus pictus]